MLGQTYTPYSDKVLMPNEQIVYKGSHHWLHRLAVSCLIILSVIGCIWSDYFMIPALLLFLLQQLYFLRMEIVVTNKRLIYKRGSFRLKIDEITPDFIERYRLEKGLFGSVFGYGHLSLYLAHSMLEIPFLADPVGLRVAIEKIEQ